MADSHFRRTEEVQRVGRVVRWLDEAVPIPGTRMRVGLDAALGLLLPGLGDALTAAVGLSVVVAAIRRGVPNIVVARMLLNLGIDALVGLVPLLGDAFDVFFKANTRNYALLQRHQGELEPQARPSDYVVLAAAAAVTVATVAMPFVLAWLLISALV